MLKPLEKRTFKYKSPHMEFYCPLCRTQRAIVTKPHMSILNYVQIVLITGAITACLYPFMDLMGLFSFFVVWAAFEGTLRLNFRKEVPCPHCGFDASWYKKDVNIARAKIEQFWSQRGINNKEIMNEFDDMGTVESQAPTHNTSQDYLGEEASF